MRALSIIFGCITGILLAQALPTQSWRATASCADAWPTHAIEGAKAWLSLIDNGNSDQSWNQSSAYFQSHVPKAQWAATVKQVRDIFGHVLYRSFSHREQQSSLPGAPAGRYVVLHFIMDGNRHRGFETVTMMIQGDAWLVTGYYISGPYGIHVSGAGALPMHWD
jgi:hypothetical protein